MTAIQDTSRKHEGIVGQAFTDPMDAWQAECSCGWRLDQTLPYWEAVSAAQGHAERANGSFPTPTISNNTTTK